MYKCSKCENTSKEFPAEWHRVCINIDYFMNETYEFTCIDCMPLPTQQHRLDLIIELIKSSNSKRTDELVDFLLRLSKNRYF
jgi:hypothetical protein